MLFHLGYTSTATRPMVGSELWALLELAQSKNAAKDLTGLLLHRQNSFFQVLEGPKIEVLKMFEHIKSDKRHKRVEVLFEGGIEAREFSDWRMGFVQLDGIDVSQLPGFSRFLQRDAEPRELFAVLSKTRRLMMMFRDMV
jgi:hypothetical protein